jgi:hypothetical protein
MALIFKALIQFFFLNHVPNLLFWGKWERKEKREGVAVVTFYLLS